MNLTAFFRRDAAIEDHSLVDHSWMSETGLARIDEPILNIESMRNPNNVKPQLEVEWGLGGTDINFDEPAGEVKRNIPDENLGDANAVILFARDMMNRGFRGRQVVASLRNRFPPVLLKTASKGLRDLFALEGLVGRIMVDSRGYRSCHDAVKASSSSPYKRFIKYVYGCSCGDSHMIPMNEADVIGPIQTTSGNGMDDFLASQVSTVKLASHCRSTMMPIMASQGDLDKSFLDSTLIEMMNLTPVPQGVVKKLWAMSGSNLMKARAAFRWLDKQMDAAEDAKYAGKVDANEFKVRQADNEIDLFGPVQEALEVDGTNPDLSTDIEPEGFSPTNFDGPEKLPSVFSEVDLMGPVVQDQIPVEMTDGENTTELELQDANIAPGQIDLDERSGDLEVELFDSPQIDVEMSQFNEPEFEGTDEVELEEPQEAPEELDVNMAPNQDIDL